MQSPILSGAMFGANREFGSLDDVITIRYDAYFRDPDPDWSRKPNGDAHKIRWLSDRLGNQSPAKA
ncbi:MAG TPA: hypothetical protein QF611_03050 [Pseudomonadales bacterium]|nr:hypothetical protein [Pseudomonadales bacterium]MDP6316842.1 hypothetical protein [Pseudomonadales bacterium]HJP49989.1 hypothetical protein [Pseudomonadales bacterium]